MGLSVIAGGSASEKTKNKEKLISKDDEKEQNDKVMNSSRQIFAQSTLSSGPVAVETPLIKGNKNAVLPGSPAKASTSNAGVDIPAGVVARILTESGGDEDTSMNMMVFETPVFSDDAEISSKANSATLDLNIKSSEGATMDVEVEQGFRFEIENKACDEALGADIEQECAFFDTDIQKMSKVGCNMLMVDEENCKIHCVCTHMTSFFATLGSKFTSKFGNANWGLFGGSA